MNIIEEIESIIFLDKKEKKIKNNIDKLYKIKNSFKEEELLKEEINLYQENENNRKKIIKGIENYINSIPLEEMEKNYLKINKKIDYIYNKNNKDGTLEIYFNFFNFLESTIQNKILENIPEDYIFVQIGKQYFHRENGIIKTNIKINEVEKFIREQNKLYQNTDDRETKKMSTEINEAMKIILN